MSITKSYISKITKTKSTKDHRLKDYSYYRFFPENKSTKYLELYEPGSKILLK